MIISFDTSNYTTSVAVLEQEKIICDYRRLIKVKSGGRGIRQSDGFFQHMQVLDEFIKNEFSKYRNKLQAIGVSTRPRPIAGSYMPVFRAGEIIATSLATGLDLPLIKTSHQEGHLFSALSEQNLPSDFLFFHISGGTTEIHSASQNGALYDLKLIAETGDINFGQLIDRIGVKMGLAFPAGAAMDKERRAITTRPNLPKFKVKQNFNLSGYENHFEKLAQNGMPKAELYQLLFELIAEIIMEIVTYARQESGLKDILIAGGVAENSVIKERLRVDSNIKFAANNRARDNAIGVALLTKAVLASRED